MKKEDLFPPERLRKLIEYDPETGVLTWKPRVLEDCRSDAHMRTFNSSHAGKPALNANHIQGYKHGAIFGTYFLAHRVCWAIHYDKWPDNKIDHISGVRTDNRISNLRDVSDHQNATNSKLMSNNTSGCPGVNWVERVKSWRVWIYVKKKRHEIGYFKDFEDAVAARKAAEVKYQFHPNHGRK